MTWVRQNNIPTAVNMFYKYIHVIIILSVLSLYGCGSTSDVKIKPTKLYPYKPSLFIHPVWYKQPIDSVIRQVSKLRPVIDDGKLLYVNEKGHINALDNSTGKRLWHVKLPDIVSGGLGQSRDLLFVGTLEGYVVALTKQDGEVVWRTPVSSEVLTVPQSADGVVVVRTIDGKVFGLDERSGLRLWVYENTVPTLTLRGVSVPVLAKGQAIAGFANGKLIAISLNNGEVLWETTIAVPEGRSELERLIDIDADPVVKGDILYVAAYQERIVAINIISGRIIWSQDLSSYSALAVDDFRVYLTDEQSQIFALDNRTGAVLWRQDKLQGRGATAPTIYKDYIVVGDYAGYLHWMSQNDGSIVARKRIGNSGILISPIVEDDVLYANDQSNMFIALKADKSR